MRDRTGWRATAANILWRDLPPMPYFFWGGGGSFFFSAFLGRISPKVSWRCCDHLKPSHNMLVPGEGIPLWWSEELCSCFALQDPANILPIINCLFPCDYSCSLYVIEHCFPWIQSRLVCQRALLSLHLILACMSQSTVLLESNLKLYFTEHCSPFIQSTIVFHRALLSFHPILTYIS